MKKEPIIIIIAIVLFMGFNACDEPEPTLTMYQEIEQLAKLSVILGKTPGIAVGIIHNDEKKFFSYGVANLDTGAEIDENTIFEIGSITKTFTGLLFARLHLEGRLNLQDDANVFLPKKYHLPEKNGVNVRIVHLLNHTSGLDREPSDLDPAEPYWYTNDQMSSYLTSATLNAIPGTIFGYSNSGFGLAGLMLENLTDSSYASLVKSNLFDKMFMNSSFCNEMDTPIKNVAQGYLGNRTTGFLRWTNVFAAAGIIKSNMHDMLNYLNYTIHPERSQIPDAINLGLTPSFNIDSNIAIGLSWFIGQNTGNQRIAFHDGGTRGFSSFIGMNKEKKNGVVVFMNSFSSGDQAIIGAEIMKILDKY